ncbi:TetR/AcrR family transcriptional regulator [Rhodococcus sp. D2-41]|uniref:TetR/AcrR family transcriptional regulator n=1 Tax=Speluncibacter jeojiensis TaxID=2710754 RepID=A0A9X4M110_9ACTN|nr:TetR/AcrR family transcriptional regulator [Rhodococcus sp. D2-41]MDG3011635.1 TetR/AcrR family transcriptional regulator [Rhodococcus sp. D2-41]MDG3015010.1 TetR/AcrR family transcriptional regulator [Corynebacteriales bacterium D3-21]
MFTEHVQSRGEQRDATRQKVLSTAERLFRESGYGATTVRQIAAAAEVSTGTVMAVGDKAGLLVAIFEGWIGQVHAGRTIASTADAVLAPGQAADAIIGLLEPFVEYFARDRELSREYAAIIVRGSHTSEIFERLALALLGELHAVLVRTGISPESAGRGARAVYFAYLGVLMTASSGALDQDTAIDQFRDVVRHIISPEGSPR